MKEGSDSDESSGKGTSLGRVGSQPRSEPVSEGEELPQHTEGGHVTSSLAEAPVSSVVGRISPHPVAAASSIGPEELVKLDRKAGFQIEVRYCMLSELYHLQKSAGTPQQFQFVTQIVPFHVLPSTNMERICRTACKRAGREYAQVR